MRACLNRDGLRTGSAPAALTSSAAGEGEEEEGRAGVDEETGAEEGTEEDCAASECAEGAVCAAPRDAGTGAVGAVGATTGERSTTDLMTSVGCLSVLAAERGAETEEEASG